MSTINKSSPTEIISKVMRSDTVKSAHPLFEPTIVGIDVLNVVDLGDNPNACGQIDRTVGDAHFPSGGAQCLAAVGAEDSIACQYGLERSADVHLVSLLQNEVGCAPGTITANQHRNLFVGQAALRSLATALAGRSCHSLFLALERFKEKGLVRFGNANQARGLLFIGQRKKTMTPAECRVAMHVTGFGTFANALPFGHLLRVFQPLVLVAQSSQRRSCQRIECGLAGSAAVALQSRGRTPARDVVMTTLGAHRCRQCATFDQSIDGLDVPNLSQALLQKSSLVRCQLLKLFRQCLEFFGSHRFTYLTDSYEISIDHYLKVT